MNFYSQTISAFISKLMSLTKEILREEIKVEVKNKRFLYKHYTYPLKFVVFEKKNTLGEFNPDLMQIGLHKNCLFYSQAVLKDILRHELAHYFCFIEYGSLVDAHGSEFKKLCHLFGFEDSVSHATMQETQETPFSSDLFNKIQKLLRLSASDNIHESTLATQKAKSLLIKHNLDFQNDNLNDDEYCVLVISTFKKSSLKINKLMGILAQYLVSPVLNYGQENIYLEVTGKRENVLIAQYIFHFLNNEFERLWSEYKKNNKEVRGIKDKNSFILGLSYGYQESLESITLSAQEDKALMLVSQRLDEIKNNYYGRFRSKGVSTLNYNSALLNEGKKQGRNIKIRNAVSHHPLKIGLLT